ncbi:MAG: hypothetical protein IID33_08250 [Planctomycetes bacterium]|nr:hypothetical protein [Planctomycetota bacterium]
MKLRNMGILLGAVTLPYVLANIARAQDPPPQVTVLAPNGGEVLPANAETLIEYIATDNIAVVRVELFSSIDGGQTWRPIAQPQFNTGTHRWMVPNRRSTTALIRVVAFDSAGQPGEDISDADFTVDSPPAGLVPTTLRDFDLPGSQAFEAGLLRDPAACAGCHADYDPAVEPYFNWSGSMMALASRDPLFEAAMTIANQDAGESGDLCLRCHTPTGWTDGRSVPTDGSRLFETDKVGVSCDFCHRLVDPIYDPENPLEDEDILANLMHAPDSFGNGQYVLDPNGIRRGPFRDGDLGHYILYSPFHREAALCGTCHDVSNPVLESDGQGNYVPNALNEPPANVSPNVLMPIERTYSEWFGSDYHTPGGVYAPQFGGNLDFVASCQDCHMRDVTGQGCSFPNAPIREDLPLHDMTGGNTWMPGVIANLFPGQVSRPAVDASMLRARYMLQNAAEMDAVQQGPRLMVTVTNNTGHKLPTGYPEGRRIWINIKFFDQQMTLLDETGRYDPLSGVLTHDPQIKIYEIELGLDQTMADLTALPIGPSFHFVLNNKVFKDNRIPPRGFTNAAYAEFGGGPVAAVYADGQYWDDTLYSIPPGATRAEVTLYYQTTSKEYVEFLRDENSTNSSGQVMYDAWIDNDKAPPEEMATAVVVLDAPLLGDVNCDGTVNALDIEPFLVALFDPAGYPLQYPDCDINLADINGDGSVNALDIEGFLNLLFP